MDFKFKINTGIKPSKGKILIAEPLLADPHFQRGVVYLCGHNTDGSFGFVVNKPIDKTLDHFVENLERTDIPLFLGGPVETSSLLFLHTKDNLLGGAPAGNNIFVGGDFEKAIELLQKNEISPNEIKFFIGYSGWGEKQLDQEVQKNSWLVSTTSQPQIFRQNINRFWEETILALDKQYHQLVNLPRDPNLN